MRSKVRAVGFGLVLTSSAVFGIVQLKIHQSKSPQPHWQSMEGLMTGAKTLSLSALQKSLPPRIRTARRVIIIMDACACPYCTRFYTKRNDSGLPGILVTDATPARDLPASNLTTTRNGTGMLTDEMETADQGALLIDFIDRTIVVAKGPFDNWHECLEILRNNSSTYKVKI